MPNKEDLGAYIENIRKGAAFGLSGQEMLLARGAAIRAIVDYGEEHGDALDAIKRGEIHNDHVAVQAAIQAIKMMKEKL